MKKTNMHIEIVSSTTKGLSSMNERSRNAILLVLSKHYSKVGITIVNNLLDLQALVARKPDIVFLGMKYLPVNAGLGNEDPGKIWLSGYLDNYGIAYTGSGQKANQLEANKHMAKRRVQEAGLKTSPFYVLERNQPRLNEAARLIFPLFIKPTNRGGGEGVDSHSVVNTMAELDSKVKALACKLNADSLVEEYLPGREITVAILKCEFKREFMVMPLERVVLPDKDGISILSPQVKRVDAGRSIAVGNKILRDKISELALSVFHALGARDYGRIDIRLDKYGTPHFLEANLIPSLIEGYGNFPKSCVLNKNLDYELMILHIVRLAQRRRIVAAPVKLELEVPSLITALNPT